MKISAMTRMVESYQAWLEYITYQMCTMSHEEANAKIGLHKENNLVSNRHVQVMLSVC